MKNRPKLSAFLSQRFGGNDWVLAPGRRAGALQIAWSDYKAAVRAYRVEFGDPHDEGRAAMYLALKRALFVLESPAIAHLVNGAGTLDLVRAAIAAEEERPI